MSILDIILRWEEFINKLKRKGAWLPLIKFAIPFIIAAEAIGIMYLTLDRATFAKLAVAMSAYFFPPAGKESMIPLAVGWEFTLLLPHLPLFL